MLPTWVQTFYKQELAGPLPAYSLMTTMAQWEKYTRRRCRKYEFDSRCETNNLFVSGLDIFLRIYKKNKPSTCMIVYLVPNYLLYPISQTMLLSLTLDDAV